MEMQNNRSMYMDGRNAHHCVYITWAHDKKCMMYNYIIITDKLMHSRRGKGVRHKERVRQKSQGDSQPIT